MSKEYWFNRIYGTLIPIEPAGTYKTYVGDSARYSAMAYLTDAMMHMVQEPAAFKVLSQARKAVLTEIVFG
jgi:hypothetical protein